MVSARITIDTGMDEITITVGPQRHISAATDLAEATRESLARAVVDANTWLNSRTRKGAQQ
jgi:hypothetical protein